MRRSDSPKVTVPGTSLWACLVSIPLPLPCVGLVGLVLGGPGGLPVLEKEEVLERRGPTSLPVHSSIIFGSFRCSYLLLAPTGSSHPSSHDLARNNLITLITRGRGGDGGAVEGRPAF